MSSFEQRRERRAQMGIGERERIGVAGGRAVGFIPDSQLETRRVARSYQPATPAPGTTPYDPPWSPLEEYGFTLGEIAAMSSDEIRGWLTVLAP